MPWRLSSASFSRRLLWGRIHAFLSRQAGREFDEELRRLQQGDVELLRASTQHVAKWTTDAVLADWHGYCDASEEMRRKMIEAIRRENQLPISSGFGYDRKAGDSAPHDQSRSVSQAQRCNKLRVAYPDLWETGCKIEFVEKPWLGETVCVKFEGLETLRSTVRWSDDFTVGLEFERPIDSRVLEWSLNALD